MSYSKPYVYNDAKVRLLVTNALGDTDYIYIRKNMATYHEGRIIWAEDFNPKKQTVNMMIQEFPNSPAQFNQETLMKIKQLLEQTQHR